MKIRFNFAIAEALAGAPEVMAKVGITVDKDGMPQPNIRHIHYPIKKRKKYKRKEVKQ